MRAWAFPKIARSFSSGSFWSASLAVIAAAVAEFGVGAGEVPGFYKDPDTGVVYRKVTRTVERPEVTTTQQRRERTVLTPRTVTEERPYSRTVYTPVTEYRWVPKIHNRWNPFRSPTLVYHHQPTTTWEARNEVVNRATSRTEWVAEKRVDTVPVTTRRIVREERQVLEPVQTLSPRQTSPGPTSAIAANLRPLDESELQQGGPDSVPPSASIARNPNRSAAQSGQRAIDLRPTAPGYHQPLAPAGSLATPFTPLSVFR